MTFRNFILSLAIYAAIWAIGGWYALALSAIVCSAILVVVIQ